MFIWAYDFYYVPNVKWIPGPRPVSNGQVATNQEKTAATIGTLVGSHSNGTKSEVVKRKSHLLTPSRQFSYSRPETNGQSTVGENCIMIVLPSFFFVNKTGDLFFQGCQSHTFHNSRNKERNVALSLLTRSPCCDSECCQSHAWALDQNQVAQQTVFKLWPSVPLCCTAFTWKKKKKKVLLAANAFHLPKKSLNRYSTPNLRYFCSVTLLPEHQL